MAAQYYKINYKSDFVLTINSDAGWAVPFCIKFWTGMPSHGYFAGFDGENYVNCRVGETPTQLLVMFDDHHMPIGPLRMQIAYHTTIEEFPDRKFDEVTNPTNVTVDIDGTEYQVMLDFTGETGEEIDFSMPSSGVMSVNGKIGYVTLNAEDVGAQPTIEDLSTIRSGAAAGATAVQPAEMTAALATKQDTIPDLANIRSGAAAGATAVQPATLQEGLATKQNVISDLATIRSGAAAGATAVQPAAITPIQTALQTIEAVIPSAASAQNQLADKNIVNSSISTNTANFVGTFETLAELQAVQNPTNNDYGFVIETDAQGNEYYDRYKYVASSQQWLFEYKVESTPFTAAQWAAIQSGITSALVTKLNALPTNAELQQTLDGKANTSDIPTALSQLSQDSTHRVVTDAEKSTWNGKQNAIDDLATIRSGAAAGATAVQPAAMNTALAAKQDTLTFDNTPTANSSNPVKSSGIKTALDAKQSTISTVNVTVDNNTGTPSGSASVSGSTLSLSFQNLKGATGATGATGPQGPQGERGLPGESGVTGDVSGFTVIQTIDPSATYGATDIAGAATVQATNAELTELAGEVEDLLQTRTTTQLDFSTVEGTTVRRYSPFAVVTGLTATFYCAYIEIDNTMETVRVTSTDNKAYSLIQGIYLFSSIPASEGNADSQLDYVEFTNTGTTYQKDIPITPEMYGKYLVVTSHSDCNLQIFNITTENKIDKINEDLDALADDISELRQDDSALEERIETIEEKLTENVSDLLTYTTISESTVRKSDRKLLGNLSTNYRTVYLLIDGSYTSYRIKSTDNINYQNIQGVYLFSDTPAVNGFGDAQLDFVDFTNSGSEVDRTIPIDQSMTGKYLVITTHANCNLQIYGLLQRDKFDYLENQIEENQEQDDIRYVQLSSAIQKYPKEGVNLIELENIQANKMVDANGNFKTYNGWRGIEIEFCSTDVPIFLNLIYSGYYSLIDAAGNVVKVVQTSGRDMYSGYKLPSGVVKGRFSINSDISDSDISAYAYISYGRPLMQDEVNVRVGFEASYSMYKSERPTDYDGGDICAFEKILCIGDSITDGAFNYTAISGQTFTAREALSYPSNLASITGRTVINLGDSGESPSSWWAAHQNDAELTGVDCAIIELGINGSNDELNTDTKTAFDSIISALKTRNQKIKIFISSIPTGKAYRAQLSSDTYYQKDQWLRTYYDTYYANDNQVFFLDVARYGHLRDKYSSGNYDDYNEGHLSAYGYWRLAMDYRNYISYIMKNSNSDFKNIQFTGTDFEFQ